MRAWIPGTGRAAGCASLLVACGLLGPRPLRAEPAPRDVRVSDAAVPAAEAALRVGYAGSLPFVEAGEPPAGLSVSIWRTVADRAGFGYALHPQPNVEAALQGVADGQLDVAIGPISITAQRARHVHFSQPYFDAALGILARTRSGGTWERIAPFLTRVFAGASLVLIVCLVGIGLVVWLLERRRNPEQFPPDPIRGIGNGIWFAPVTMTTVGYGDRAPVTVPGRLVSAMWMLAALVTTSSLTAGIASAFTVLQLDTASVRDIGELEGERVAVVAGTTAAAFAAERGLRMVEHATLDEAIAALEREGVLAVVHDRPMLQYYLHERPDSELQLAPASYEPHGYGFAVARGSALAQRINVALLVAREQGEVRRLAATWLGLASTARVGLTGYAATARAKQGTANAAITRSAHDGTVAVWSIAGRLQSRLCHSNPGARRSDWPTVQARYVPPAASR